ncbi:MAG: aldehyde dehydrogenase family protein, partial [Xanthomonadales bacterium]|nr:aldehyde dehydrogenase family protein [Xanthomonadales bacterium]
MPMTEILNFIDNRFEPAQDGSWLDVVEPATGTRYARLANSGTADVARAVSAARDALPAWRQAETAERARFLNSMADLIEARAEEFAQAESRDTGKPISLARSVDIPRAIANFRFFAAAATQFASESHAMGEHAINYTLRQPLGVVACISPWNLPIYLLSWKVAPALAAGNTVVAKPSEVTPYTASLLGEVALESGLPGGVLNIVHGEGRNAGSALVEHPEVRGISFTGSTQTGQSIASATAAQFKKLSLEMGGKNATIVFADCEFEKTVAAVARAAFANQGQICLCGSRILVERPIYDQFRDALLAHCKRLVSADPSLEDTQHGALVSQAHFEKVQSYLELAVQEGGVLLCGGPARLEGRCAGGWFVNPV